MGIHVGEAQERDGNWFGTSVNRAARVADAANAGQLLLSQAAELAARDVVADHASIDVGRVRLKGLEREETLFHVTGQAFGDPMAPRMRLAAATKRPDAATDLLGRTELIEEVRGILEGARVVSLTGPGGVGKTQLALAVVASSGVDAVFVDLAPTESGRVVEAFGEALGVSTDQRGQLPSVAAATIGHDLLLVDNGEHVIDAVASTLAGILSANPDISVLLTSREAIGRRGERVVKVPPLPIDAAVDLFVERAANVGAVVDPEDEAIAEICRRLDGLPLAIELAAGRSTLLTPGQILDRLDQRFRLLAGGRRGVDRQQTLEGVMDWSYDLLDADEQDALRAACVFVGGFDLEAFVAVSGLDEFDALDLLASLAAKSLIVTTASEDAGRYSVLETVRIYGLAKAEAAGDANAIAAAHARYYCDLTGSPGGWPVSFRAWEDYFLAHGSQPDEGNIRAALRWFAGIGDLRSIGILAAGALLELGVSLWDQEGEYFGRDDVASSLEDRERELYQLASAFAANGRGDWPAQLALATGLREASDDPEIRAVATGLIALIAAFFDGYDVPAMIEEAIAELDGRRPDLVGSLRSRANDRALGTGHAEVVIESITEQSKAGDVVAMTDLAKAHVMLGRFDDALDWLDDAPLIVGPYLGLWRDMVLVHALAESDPAQAIRHLLAAEQRLRQHYDRLVEAELIVAAAAIALGSGDATHASRLLAATGASFRTPGGYGIYSVVRDRVRAALSHEAVQRIRSEAASTTPHEAFRAELERLRSTLDESPDDPAP
jgi:predicted ATPase